MEELRAEATRAWELTYASRYEELGELLPDLIRECEAACRHLTGDDRRTAFQLAANAYQAVAATMAKLRQVDAAWVAGDKIHHRGRAR